MHAENRKIDDRKIERRKIAPGARAGFAVALALASTGAFTAPTPPPGSVLIQDYYTDANHTTQVGARTYGTCPQGPSPTGWGATSKYSTYRIYTCPSSVQRIPKP